MFHDQKNGDDIIRNIIINRMIRSYSPVFEAVAAKRIAGGQSARKEIIQEFIYRKLCRKTPAQLEEIESKGAGYIRNAFRNFITDEIRRINRQPQIDSIYEITGIQMPRSISIDERRIAEIKEAFSQVYGETTGIIIEFLLIGFSRKEIAKKIGSSEGSIYTRISRLKKDPRTQAIIEGLT